MSALPLGKNDKYEYLTGEEILIFNQRQTIEHAKFTCFPLRKAFEKQTEAIEDQGKKNKLKQLKIKKKNNKGTWKESWKKLFIHRSKINQTNCRKGK